LAEAQLIAEDSDRKYDEVIRLEILEKYIFYEFRLHVVLLLWKWIWNVLKIVLKPLKRKDTAVFAFVFVLP
jgi:hypothetical protein